MHYSSRSRLPSWAASKSSASTIGRPPKPCSPRPAKTSPRSTVRSWAPTIRREYRHLRLLGGRYVDGSVDRVVPAGATATPGVIGIFGASAGTIGRGDSVYISGAIDGHSRCVQPRAEARRCSDSILLRGRRPNSPLVSPLVSSDVIARFPPTLIVTGTRAADLSGSAYSHYQMKKLGVQADLSARLTDARKKKKKRNC